MEKNVTLDECLKKVQQENEDLKARMDKHAAKSRFFFFILWFFWFYSVLFVGHCIYTNTILLYLLCNLNYNIHMTFFPLSIDNCPQSRQSCRNHFRRRQKWTSVSQWKTRSCCGSYTMETWAAHAKSLPPPPLWLCSPLATQAFSPAPPFLPDNTSHQLPRSSFLNTLPGTGLLSTLKAILAGWVHTLSPEGHESKSELLSGEPYTVEGLLRLIKGLHRST